MKKLKTKITQDQISILAAFEKAVIESTLDPKTSVVVDRYAKAFYNLLAMIQEMNSTIENLEKEKVA